jgi:hypothetical protein
MEGQEVSEAHGTCPQHTPSLTYTRRRLGAATFASDGTTLLIAKDVQGRWWDCRSGYILTELPEAYLTKRMEQVGLKQFTPALIALSLRPALPRDYV